MAALDFSDQQWFASLSRIADVNSSADDPEIPPFPDPTLQRRTTGQAGSAGLIEVWRYYLDCREMFHTLAGRPLGEEDKMLDFGCGWGRIGRLFMRDILLENLYGMDVNPELVEECATRFANGNFTATLPLPPTAVASGTFDLITGFSVFSHLSEAACQAWMAEFARICKPGGLIAMTTRGRGFFNYCKRLRGTAVEEGYPYALSVMFDDFDAAISKYDRGEFVHSNSNGVTGRGVLTGKFYGETFIPKQYAQTKFGPALRLVRWLPGGKAGRVHPVMFFTPNSASF